MTHALQDAGMGEIIDNKNSLFSTMFAVQNDFFRKMIFEMDDRIAYLLSKNQSMQQALTGYMVVEGTYSANDLSNKDQEFLNTLTFNSKNNSALQLFVESMGGENTIVLSGADQNAVVIERDIYACNGIIHVISHGLSPIKIGTANDQQSANQFSTFEIPQQNVQNVTYVPLLQSNVSQTMQNIANLLSDQINAPSNAQKNTSIISQSKINLVLQTNKFARKYFRLNNNSPNCSRNNSPNSPNNNSPNNSCNNSFNNNCNNCHNN
eukprot:TRINITY_DN3057_c0_g1_i8.p2 TRINITY_DN3057_c0_g1~~TRINITY_DN3057_c0_g1_i8.p2  ORF type:complete len:265 (-),score=14.60 TRINITY_DN3057_c0_g1_i8:408-1202(-)